MTEYDFLQHINPMYDLYGHAHDRRIVQVEDGSIIVEYNIIIEANSDRAEGELELAVQ